MGLYTIRSGATAMTERTLLQMIQGLITVDGVVDSDSGHLEPTESSPAAMTIDVAAGEAYIKSSTTTYPVYVDSSETVTISANASGNPRIDAVVLYIDTAASPDATASNVAKLVAVAGTPAGSPSAPSDGDIDTSLSNKPWIRIANVAVANGASSIVNADITDQRSDYETFTRLSDDSVIGSKLSLDTFEDVASGSIALTTSDKDITGLAVTVTTAGTYLVMWSVLFTCTDEGTGANGVGTLYNNGVAETSASAQSLNPQGFTLNNLEVQGSASAIVTVANDGDILKIMAKKTSNTGTYAAKAGNGTHMTVVRIG